MQRLVVCSLLFLACGGCSTPASAPAPPPLGVAARIHPVWRSALGSLFEERSDLRWRLRQHSPTPEQGLLSEAEPSGADPAAPPPVKWPCELLSSPRASPRLAPTSSWGDPTPAAGNVVAIRLELEPAWVLIDVGSTHDVKAGHIFEATAADPAGRLEALPEAAAPPRAHHRVVAGGRPRAAEGRRGDRPAAAGPREEVPRGEALPLEAAVQRALHFDRLEPEDRLQARGLEGAPLCSRPLWPRPPARDEAIPEGDLPRPEGQGAGPGRRGASSAQTPSAQAPSAQDPSPSSGADSCSARAEQGPRPTRESRPSLAARGGHCEPGRAGSKRPGPRTPARPP